MLLHKNTIAHYLFMLIICFPFSLSAVLPAPTLETERCILRQLTLDDAEALFPLASNPEVGKYTPMFGGLHQTPADTAGFIQKLLKRQLDGADIYWVIIEKSSNTIIGMTCILGHSEHYRRAELGRFLLPDYWNKGVGAEIARAIITYAFAQLQLIRLQTMCDPNNLGSARSIERAGLTCEGLLRNYYIVNGKPCDRKIYSITDEEFNYLYQDAQ